VFIQVVQGKCTREEELRAHLERWREEQGPKAEGWLGGTYGFTDDHEFLGIVRFESREAAMANSEREEQSAWAREMTALMDGPVEFHDCDDVTLMLDGGSDEAGFVQVIRGKVDDVERAKAMMTRDATSLHEMRPELIGATMAVEDDGTFIETVFFTDEASARKGEQLEAPPEVREDIEMLMAGARFYDLHRPWFASR
jgi:ribosomal protein S6E (S10)